MFQVLLPLLLTVPFVSTSIVTIQMLALIPLDEIAMYVHALVAGTMSVQVLNIANRKCNDAMQTLLQESLHLKVLRTMILQIARKFQLVPQNPAGPRHGASKVLLLHFAPKISTRLYSACGYTN